MLAGPKRGGAAGPDASATDSDSELETAYPVALRRAGSRTGPLAASESESGRVTQAATLTAVRSESAVMATGRGQACQADSEARLRRPLSRLLVSHGPPASRGRRRRAATCPPAAAPRSVTGSTTCWQTVIRSAQKP